MSNSNTKQPVPAATAEAEDTGYELGDRILVLGGKHNELKGRIYYIDPELIRILPDGLSNQLIDLPIVETDDGYDIDPSLEIQALYLLSKRANPAFVAQIAAQIDDIVETFDADGNSGPTYTVKAINEKEDSIVLVDTTGAEEEIQFNFTGIPQDEPFVILRPRQSPLREENVYAEEEGNTAENEEEEMLDQFEDLLNSELAQVQEEDAEQGVAEIRETSASQRHYTDSVQREDMYRNFIAALDAASQKSPEIQKEIRSLVEQCMLLRNTIVQYSRAGIPMGKFPTSYLSLADLINNTNIPLLRPVLNVAKVLNFTHTPEHLIVMGAPPDVDSIPGADVVIKYLDDEVNRETFLASQATGPSLTADALPNWYLAWETINKQHIPAWIPLGGGNDVKPFREDKDFFRMKLPQESKEVDGLTMFGDTPAIPAYVTKLGMSIQRGLGPRNTRLNQKDTLLQRIESAEEAEVLNTILFPLSEQRHFGAIRSGQIAKDIALSHLAGQTTAEILDRLDGIPERATAGGIVTVGPDGNTQGNIPLEDWIQALPIYPLGLADVLVELSNYGIGQVEFNTDQQEVLIQKIDTYRALVKQYITELREAANKEVSQLTSEQNPFLTGEAAAEILDLLEGEPLLQEKMKELRTRIPAYKENDIAIIAGLLESSADLVMKVLAQQPAPLAKERNRKVRDQFLEALQNAMRKALNLTMSGQQPTPNDCEHVADYARIQKVKNDMQRMQLFSKFLTQFQGKREDNWVNCNSCGEHLVCYHEVLLLKEVFHPREKDALHKELLLTFSGGQFHGRYMCKNCGQTISDLEYDSSLEFTDDGIPMIGRGTLEDPDQVELAQVEQLLGPAELEEDKLEFKTDTQALIHKVARRIMDMVGIYAENSTYLRIVQRVETVILQQPSLDDYKKQAKERGIKFSDTNYTLQINQILVGSTAANCLIEIQTHIPGYVMRYKMPGCRAGFTGYPMGNEKDRTGLEYISCAVAAIRDDAAPWNLTGFNTISNDAKRQEKVITVVLKLLEKLINTSDVQQQMTAKRQYLKDIYGNVIYSEQLPEQILPRFAPIPYSANNEETAKNAIVPQAATEEQRIQAWILQAHQLSKENGIYVSGNPYSEATCCLKPIQEPNAFWKEKAAEMPNLPLKEPPKGPTKSHLAIHFKPRPLSRLEGAISPEVIYKIFLNVCYDGPNKGLPHKPGYTNECAHCGFVFPENPYVPRPFPPFNKDLLKAYNEEMYAIITKGRVALETQKIAIDERAFEDVVDASHKAFRVEPLQVKKPLAGMELFNQFSLLTPEPFDGWSQVIKETMERLSKLTNDADEVQIAEAYGPISTLAVEIMESFKTRLGETAAQTLLSVLESSPAGIAETVTTYFMVPFQRLISGFDVNVFTNKSAEAAKTVYSISNKFDISRQTAEDVLTLLTSHFQFMNILKNTRSTGRTQMKLQWARDRLCDAILILKKYIRGAFIVGGNQGLRYVTAALIGGILEEFMDPDSVLPIETDTAGTIDTGARAPMQILDILIKKVKQEGLNYTEEELRELIARRDEKEKHLFISRFENLTPEEKAMVKMNQKLGLKEWAISGKQVYAYDPEQYDRDREQRIEMGIQDYLMGGDQMAGPADGYDTAQIQEDDY